MWGPVHLKSVEKFYFPGDLLQAVEREHKLFFEFRGFGFFLS